MLLAFRRRLLAGGMSVPAPQLARQPGIAEGAHARPVPAATRCVVIIASTGRAQVIERNLLSLAKLNPAPDLVVLSVASEGDLPRSAAIAAAPFEMEIVRGPRGLTRQRNRGLKAARGRGDVVLFIDDDYVPRPDAIARLIGLMNAERDINGVTGILLADGIDNEGYTIDEAQTIVRQSTPDGRAPRVLRDIKGLYGCNMAFRASAIEDIDFDERLPAYGWQEDIDFTAQVPGRLVVSDALIGVHCGTKNGRERRGERLGYSQVANPLYLASKGTMTVRTALRHMLRNMAANHVKSLRPESWVDRAGRARGNRLALMDLLMGRLSPERAMEIV